MNDSGLKSTIKTENNASICNLSGEISYDTVIQLRSEFAHIRDNNPKSVILDLTGLNELGSAGLGEMARLILWCESKHCQINMVCQTCAGIGISYCIYGIRANTFHRGRASCLQKR